METTMKEKEEKIVDTISLTGNQHLKASHTEAFAQDLATNLNTVKTITITGNSVADQESGPTRLTEITTALETTSSIENFVFFNNTFANAAAPVAEIMAALKHNTHLQKLDFSNQRMTSQDVESVLSFCAHNETSLELNMILSIGIQSGPYGATQLTIDGMDTPPEFQVFCSSLSSDTRIHSLDLSQNSCNPNGVTLIANAVTNNPNIGSLDITNSGSLVAQEAAFANTFDCNRTLFDVATSKPEMLKMSFASHLETTLESSEDHVKFTQGLARNKALKDASFKTVTTIFEAIKNNSESLSVNLGHLKYYQLADKFWFEGATTEGQKTEVGYYFYKLDKALLNPKNFFAITGVCKNLLESDFCFKELPQELLEYIISLVGPKPIFAVNFCGDLTQSINGHLAIDTLPDPVIEEVEVTGQDHVGYS